MGIGESIAKTLAKAGANLILVSRSGVRNPSLLAKRHFGIPN